MSTDETKALRAAFGSFMTGVTVVTTRDDTGRPIGFTANSFTSVSLDPPLLLVCPGRFLSSFDVFSSCEYFAISVLAEGQEDVSNCFASSIEDRFSKVETVEDANGVPLIRGAVAQFSCSTHQVVEAGDHALLIGQVDQFRHAGGRGLGYAEGRYFSLGLEQDVSLASTDGLPPFVGVISEWNGAVYLEPQDEGFSLPSAPLADRRNLRAALEDCLKQAGLHATPDRVYSVYDDLVLKRHDSYFRVLADNPVTQGAGRYVPIEELPGLTFASPAQAAMMTRYAVEYREEGLGL